jgi:hypothetical protein
MYTPFNVRLNEFSKEQIERLLLLIQTELLTLQMTLARIEAWEDSNTKTRIHADTQKEWDDLMLWKCQLLNAKKDVEQLQHLN